MIIATKAYCATYRPDNGARVIRVISASADIAQYILGDSMTYVWGESSTRTTLAYDMLKDAFGKKFAAKMWQQFSEEVIEHLPRDGWIITKEDIAEKYDAELILFVVGNIGSKKA